MDGPANDRFSKPAILFAGQTKKLLPHKGQEPDSCDTTQIDANAPTRFTHHHACPRLITGGIPVEAYLSRALFRFALRSPFAERTDAPFTPPGALFGLTYAGYYSSSTVLVYAVIISTRLFACQEFLCFLEKLTIRRRFCVADMNAFTSITRAYIL